MMKLQTFSDVQKSLRGRPKSGNSKVRLSFYLNQEDFDLLKVYVTKNDLCVSEMVRNLVKPLLKGVDDK